MIAADDAISWQSRVVQAVMARAVKPRLTLGRGVAALRGTLDRLARLMRRQPRDVAIVAATRGGVPGEWTQSVAGTAAGPVLLYFHGGAFVAGSPALSRGIVTQLVQRCGGAAFSADYRLAPEHPFPAALDDAVASYEALLAEGIPPARLVLAGESAGGALALALGLRLAAAGRPLPAALVLISPWLDLSLSGPRLRAMPDIDPGLPALLMEEARHLYMPDGRFTDPLASPLWADFHGLPPVLVQVGTREILLDDARRLCVRLARSGVDQTLEEWAGMHHAWHHAPIRVPEADRAIAAIAGFVQTIGGRG